MAKLYSEKLNKYYEMNEVDLLTAEEAAFDAELAAAEEKKANKEARLHEVEQAYDDAYDAYMNAIKLKDKFVADYGSIRLKKNYNSDNSPLCNPLDLMSSLYSMFDL